MANSETEQETFDPTTVVSKSDKWVLNQAILNIWFNQLLPALQDWEEQKMQDNFDRGYNKLRSVMTTFLFTIRSSLDKEFLTKKAYPYDTTRNIIKFLSDADDADDIYTVIDLIETFLYTKGLTKWDTKEVQDRTQVWKQNQRFQG